VLTRLLICLCAVTACVNAATGPVPADCEQYEAELLSAQDREKTAKEQLAGQQGELQRLRQEIADAKQRSAAAEQEKYSTVSATEPDVVAAENEASAIEQQARQLANAPADQLAARESDVSALEIRLSALTAKPVSGLWRVRDRLDQARQAVQQVRSGLIDAIAAQQAVAAPVTGSRTSAAGGQSFTHSVSQTGQSTYEVRLVPGNRDCLYRIAGYDFVYGDPARWPTIYEANRSIIVRNFERFVQSVSQSKFSRPEDLIFPGQVLDIPR